MTRFSASRLEPVHGFGSGVAVSKQALVGLEWLAVAPRERRTISAYGGSPDAKTIAFDEMLAASTAAAPSAAAAGSKGRNVVLEKKWAPTITNDGVSITWEIDSRTL
jgi:hypothetical protein